MKFTSFLLFTTLLLITFLSVESLGQTQRKKREGLFLRLDTFLLRVKELNKSRQWYEDKLGLTISHISEKERFIVFDLGNTSLRIWEPIPNETLPSKGTAVPYPIFFTDKCEEVNQILKTRGVTVGEIEHGDRS